MDIPLLDNWRELYKAGQVKVYPLGKQHKDLINKTFDKLYTEDRLE